jgi:hypothetical protein
MMRRRPGIVADKASEYATAPDQRCTHSASKTRVNALMVLHRIRGTVLSYVNVPTIAPNKHVVSVLETVDFKIGWYFILLQC